MRRRGWVLSVTVLMELAALSAACSGRMTSESSGPTPPVRLEEYSECRDYFQSFEACMRKLSPESPEIAAARSVNARQALEPLSIEKAREACTAGAAQIHSSCL